MGLQQLFCPSCRMTKMGRVDESNKPLPASVCSDCGSSLKVSEKKSPVIVEQGAGEYQPPPTEEEEPPEDEEEDLEGEEPQEALLTSHSVFTFEQVSQLMAMIEKQLLAAKPNNVPNIVINFDEKFINKGEVSPVVHEHVVEQQNLPPRKTVKTVERDENGLIVRVVESEVS